MKSKTIKILALLLTVCAVLGVASCSMFETEEPTTEPRSESAVKFDTLNSNDAILEYVNSLLAQVNSDDIKATVSYSSDYDPKNFECENDTFAKALPTLAKLMKDGFNSKLGTEDDELKEGDSFAHLLPVKGTKNPLVLKKEDIALYHAKDGEEAIYDDGHTMIFLNEEASSRYEEASSRDAAAMKDDPEATTEYVELDEDVRKIRVVLKDEVNPQKGANLFGEIYDIPDRSKIKAEMDKLANYVTYDGTYNATYTGCEIYMEVDRVTNNVLKIEFRRNIEVEVKVTGNPANEIFKDLGTTDLKFVVNGADVYEFTYPEAAK